MKWLALLLSGGSSLLGCGAAADGDASDTHAEATAALTAAFSGHLAVSTTNASVGAPIVVTESATNLTANQVGPIILGIRRLGFIVTAVQKPRTGLCRIAGSATCNFITLAANETQTYTLTLTANAPGTYLIQGWATSSTATGGASESVTVTVR